MTMILHADGGRDGVDDDNDDNLIMFGVANNQRARRAPAVKEVHGPAYEISSLSLPAPALLN